MGLETQGGFRMGPEGICWASGAEDVTVSGLEAAECAKSEGNLEDFGFPGCGR